MNQGAKIFKPVCQNTVVQAVAYAGSRNFVHLYLDAPRWKYNPGQFVMVRPQEWKNDPVWPRPFSICEVTQDSLRLFIQVVGRGTDMLSRLHPGSMMDLWGPLGNGFEYHPEENLLILAGGMGIAPFIGLCKGHPRPERISLLFGHRSSISFYPFSELPDSMPREHMQQNNTADIEEFQDVLAQKIRDFSGRGRILACGPEPFLQVVRKYSISCKAETWLSLENKMACGVGACLGCVTGTSSGEYVQTCTHGPVFRADSIVFSEK